MPLPRWSVLCCEIVVDISAMAFRATFRCAPSIMPLICDSVIQDGCKSGGIRGEAFQHRGETIKHIAAVDLICHLRHVPARSASVRLRSDPPGLHPVPCVTMQKSAWAAMRSRSAGEFRPRLPSEAAPVQERAPATWTKTRPPGSVPWTAASTSWPGKSISGTHRLIKRFNQGKTGIAGNLPQDLGCIGLESSQSGLFGRQDTPSRHFPSFTHLSNIIAQSPGRGGASLLNSAVGQGLRPSDWPARRDSPGERRSIPAIL